MPLFSIIVPVYNTEKYISECLSSILGQTYKDFELIIINDGSTDSSLSIIETFLPLFEDVKLITQENLGLGGARNTGVDNAEGEYVFFVDSDDKIHSDALSRLKSQVNEDTDVVLFTHQTFGLKDDLFEQGVSKKITTSIFSGEEAVHYFLESKIYPAVWNKLFRRSLFINNGFRFHESNYFEDLALTPYLLDKANQISVLKEDLYYYRQRDGSIMSTSNIKHLESVFWALNEVYNLVSKNKKYEIGVFWGLFWHQLERHYTMFVSLNKKILLDHFCLLLKQFLSDKRTFLQWLSEKGRSSSEFVKMLSDEDMLTSILANDLFTVSLSGYLERIVNIDKLYKENSSIVKGNLQLSQKVLDLETSLEKWTEGGKEKNEVIKKLNSRIFELEEEKRKAPFFIKVMLKVFS